MRDKLIELIKYGLLCPNMNTPFGYACDTCQYAEAPECDHARLADLLIANGVTLQQWIPVSERPPEHGVNVLCRTMFGMRVMHWNENAELWVDDEAAHSKRFVDYWLSIPEDPEEDE